MAPGKVEDARGVPFTGPAGTLLRNELRRQGVDSRLAYYMNVVCCMPPNNQVKSVHVDACRDNLKDQLDTAGCEWVLVCGAVALEALMPNATPYTRDQEIKIHGLKLWPILHPSFILRQKDGVSYRLWRESLKMFGLFMRGMGFGEYRCVYCRGEIDQVHPPVCKKHMDWWRHDSKWKYSPPPQLRLEL